MDRFELNETRIRLFKDKTNNLKKCKFKEGLTKGYIYSENGQYAGCFAINNDVIIYFEVDKIFKNFINTFIDDALKLGGKVITFSKKDDMDNIVIFKQKMFVTEEETKKEIKLMHISKKI